MLQNQIKIQTWCILCKFFFNKSIRNVESHQKHILKYKFFFFYIINKNCKRPQVQCTFLLNNNKNASFLNVKTKKQHFNFFNFWYLLFHGTFRLFWFLNFDFPLLSLQPFLVHLSLALWCRFFTFLGRWRFICRNHYLERPLFGSNGAGFLELFSAGGLLYVKTITQKRPLYGSNVFLSQFYRIQHE